MSEQLITDITTTEARKAHAKLILESLLKDFDSTEMLAYGFNNIGTPYVKLKFKTGEYVVDLSVST